LAGPINGNKFPTGEILRKPVEVVKGRILAGGAQKSPEPCVLPNEGGGWLGSLSLSLSLQVSPSRSFTKFLHEGST